MVCIFLLFFSLFLFNINFVSSIVYSCNRTAECGCSKTDAVVNKIVGGESAVDSSWGWAISLQKNNRHFCGGAIVSPLHIITAAHCVTNSTDITTNAKVVTAIDILNQSTLSTAQVRSIVRVFSHPNYNDDSKINDIAVLRLNQPLIISYERGTARLCVPRVVPMNMNNKYPVPDSSLVAIGWGVLASGSTSIPSDLHLQQVTLHAMSANHRMCVDTSNDQIQFCAAVIGGGKDTCQGDSGGPLMHFESNTRQWVLAGVTSFGRGCGLPNFAGVYARASAYHDWLRPIVNDNFIGLPIDGNITNIPGNGASSDLISSLRSVLLLYWSLALSLYAFARR